MVPLSYIASTLLTKIRLSDTVYLIDLKPDPLKRSAPTLGLLALLGQDSISQYLLLSAQIIRSQSEYRKS